MLSFGYQRVYCASAQKQQLGARYKQFCDSETVVFGSCDKIDTKGEGTIVVRLVEIGPSAELFHACFENGLFVRATGGIIALSSR